MARIRTFKPEFFRSPDTAKASHRARILYLAMWSWADDDGIGETNIYGLLGFAFPDSDAITAAELPSLLTETRGSFGVVFYEHRGRFYYAIPAFDKHQRVERKAQGRHPKPDDPDSVPDQRFDPAAETGGTSADNQGTSVAGTGEQGNRGTGEQISGSGSLVSHQGADDVPPPEKCPRHINNPSPPSCGACADARRANESWSAKQAVQLLEAEAMAEDERQSRRKIIDNCLICDDFGRRDDLSPCDHQEAHHA